MAVRPPPACGRGIAWTGIGYAGGPFGGWDLPPSGWSAIVDALTSRDVLYLTTASFVLHYGMSRARHRAVMQAVGLQPSADSWTKVAACEAAFLAYLQHINQIPDA